MKLFNWNFVIIFILATTVSCLQDPELVPNDPITPEFSIEKSEITRISVPISGKINSIISGVYYGLEVAEVLDTPDRIVLLDTVFTRLNDDKTFSLIVDGLSPSTQYSVKSYVSNDKVKKYSLSEDFVTPPDSKATISEVSFIKEENLLQATIKDDGGREIVEYGFMRSKTANMLSLSDVEIKAATNKVGSNLTQTITAFSPKDTSFIFAYAYDNKGGLAFSPLALKLDIEEIYELSVSQPSVVIHVGDTVRVAAILAPDYDGFLFPNWESDDSNVASVSADGLITGISEGKCNVSASVGKLKSSCQVSVESVSVTGVSIDKDEITLSVGDTHILLATVEPSNAGNQRISWASSAPLVAAVSDEGAVTALSIGEASIFVTTEDGGFKAECHIIVTPAAIHVKSISFESPSIEITEGDSAKLSTIIIPEDATDKSVSWSSTDETVATVNEGVITALAKGLSVITAKTNDGGFQAMCIVTVKEKAIPVESVSLDVNELALNVGDTHQLKAIVQPNHASNKAVSWSSSEESVATVSNNGLVTAIEKGIATITVTTYDGSFTSSCVVSVTKPVTGVSLNEVAHAMTVGDSFTISAQVEPADASNITINWSSSNEDVATVSTEGLSAVVVAKSVGESIIQVTTEDGGFTAECNVIVSNTFVHVSSISFESPTLQLTEGETGKLVPIILPEEASDKSVSWASSDDSVATVKDGLITAISQGLATITATTNDGGLQAWCIVTVQEKLVPVESVSLDVNDLALHVGETYQLSATVLPDNASNSVVIWSSSVESVATVSSSGMVNAIGNGSTTVTGTTSDGGFTAECIITVTTPVTGVTLSDQVLAMIVGDSFALTASVEPATASNSGVIWSSTNEGVATVSATGLVTALAVGEATIVVTTEDGSFTAECNVVVQNAVIGVTSVTLDTKDLDLSVGSAQQLTATVLPDNATDKSLTWTSSNINVANVDKNGLVTAIGAGTAVVTATSSDGEHFDTCNVTCTIPVVNISFEQGPEMETYIGESFTLNAIFTPNDAFDKSLTWVSSNPSVATVSKDGKVTSLSTGSSIITATAKSGASASFTCTVVGNPPVFPDAVFKNYVYSNYDKNHDGFLSRSEALEITYLYIYKGGCSSLVGIEAFENLTSLDCEWNQLTSLDVSKNPSLQRLSCGYNQLTSLDISKNTQLQRLSCGSNSISSLDVSSNPELVSLSCSGNQLSEIDVIKLSKLEQLSCNSNQLTSLNVLNNLALVSLSCAFNQLTSLNISANASLEYLHCSDNKLYQLILGNHPSLSSINFYNNKVTSIDLSNCPSLSNLSCNFNQLTELNVSNNPILSILYCQENQLESIDISNCPLLTQLDCQHNELTSLSVINNTELTTLWCATNQISSLDISNNTKLVDLQCFWNQIPVLDVTKCHNLQTLRCQKNQISILDVSNCPNLSYLECGENKISTLDVQYNKAIYLLDCSQNQLSSLDVSNLYMLQRLGCSSNQLSALDVTHNPDLEILTCSGNQLSALNVSNNPKLIWLFCSENQLSNIDISNNLALESFMCSYNQLTTIDVSNQSALQSFICNNNQLTNLDVRKNIHLKELFCQSNPITDIWLLKGQSFTSFQYPSTATLHYE